jgi:hypothetical protein
MAALSKVYWRETLKLRAFGLAKIPMLLFCMPTVMDVSDAGCAVKIPLNWRTRNHLGSMYFGALCVGADCAGGMIAMFEVMRRKAPVSLVFKDYKAEFLKRPVGDVVFRCTQGEEIRGWVDQAINGDERVNGTVNLVATVPTVSDEPVAKFALTISLKRQDKPTA